MAKKNITSSAEQTSSDIKKKVSFNLIPSFKKEGAFKGKNKRNKAKNQHFNASPKVSASEGEQKPLKSSLSSSNMDNKSRKRKFSGDGSFVTANKKLKKEQNYQQQVNQSNGIKFKPQIKQQKKPFSSFKAKQSINQKRKTFQSENSSKKKPLGEESAATGEVDTKVGDSSTTNRANIMFMKKKERKLLRKKMKMAKNEGKFDTSTKLKLLWEELRMETCKEPQRSQLLTQMMKLVKGHVKEFIYQHDTARVIEWIFGLGSKEQKSHLFEEVKDSIVLLAKSKYGKFFLIKVLRCGSKDQKNHIISQFYSKVKELVCHTEAAGVVEMAFNECASALQRAALVQEFYGPNYRFFKESGYFSLQQLLNKDPGQKATVIKHMKEALTKILQKNVIRHSIVHYIIREFMVHADNESRAEIIELIRNDVVAILHTKDGSRAAMYCLWFGNNKDRKVIIKSFKTHAVKVAKEEHGHMVLLALFDCVDDTKMVEKHVISELVSNIVDLSMTLYGRKVLLYLLCPRNTLYFHPDVRKILEQGDGNPYSKKSAEDRQKELKGVIVGPLVSLVANHLHEHYTDDSFCWFVFAILKYTRGNNIDALRCLARLASTEYTQATKGNHVIESKGSHFVLKKIIAEDGKEGSDNVKGFCEVLLEEISPDALRSWRLCNRGCFLLVKILETNIPFVVESLKQILTGFRTKLAKTTLAGSELLLKKLKEC